jgi:hypothetical protein
MALGEAVSDAFSEHPSLRLGGRQIRDAASRLRWVLAAELLGSRHGIRPGLDPAILIGDAGSRADRQIGRVRVAARLLRCGERIGRHRVSLPLHLLFWNDFDWDGRHAIKNGLRTAVTVTMVNAFWYVTGWIHGSGAATWASLLCLLLAAHPDPWAESRAFLFGSLLAAVVGLTVRYTLLTTTGSFVLLAAVLLPIAMLAVIGRSDPRATCGLGYGFFVFVVLDPTNVMTYDLATSLNSTLAELLGMSVAVVAFAALPPPANEATLRLRARRRLVQAVRGIALNPAVLLPPPERYLAQGCARLALVGKDVGALRTAEPLLLIGLLLLALRAADDRLGRDVGRTVWARLAVAASEGEDLLRDLADLASEPLQAERIGTLAALVSGLDLTGWPILGPRERT